MGEAAEQDLELEQNLPGEEVENEEESSEQAGFDIVLEDDSMPESVPLGAHIKEKRKWKERTHDAEKSVEALEAENKLLRMQIDGEKPTAKPMPTLESAGYDEKLFSEQLREYYQTTSAAEARKAAQEAIDNANRANQVTQREAQIEKAMDRHYEAAKKLNVSDFDDAENRVIELFGRKAAQELIAATDNSHVMVYWLGKNPEKANYYANLVKTNPLKGVWALGQLEAKLKVQPKDKPSTVPDTPPEGGSAPKSANAWQRKLDKIREEGGQGSIRAAIALKEEAKRAGVNLS